MRENDKSCSGEPDSELNGWDRELEGGKAEMVNEKYKTQGRP
jgi:hypothetical protein